ncbi:MAG: hypothetical protein LBD23_06550 [Oscillospiraceae bacterium]|jgi:hypothetical protein|nr:hypothetical protein [Oscillospiraceae bacterium]
MKSLFQKTSSGWVKYSKYELKESGDGQLYITPSPKSKPTIYDPLENPDVMVIDALNVGLLCMNRSAEADVKSAVMEFVSKYGLMGFITALPTTPNFMDYEAAYFPKNHFIRDESMASQDYAMLFFPFEKPDFHTSKGETVWNLNNTREMMALAMAMDGKAIAQNMSFQNSYAESYNWLVTQFRDWAFSFASSFLYYEDYDSLDDVTLSLYRQGMSAFGGIAPSYHIELLDKPTIVWDFHSLLLGIQMMLSFMLTDDKKPLRICRHCQRAFAASHPNAVFCSSKCKNQFNVYKSRAKNNKE